MSTVADLLANCRNDYLMTGAREQRNKLAADVNPSQQSFSFSNDLAGMNNGTKVSVDFEDVFVWDVNTTSKSATVQRGDFGSTAASHLAGSIATINARFTDAQILRAFNAELAALSACGLYQMQSVDVTYSASINGYDLAAANAMSIWQVKYKAIGPEKEWPLIGRTLWEHQQGLSTSEFASGQAIFIRDFAQPGNPMRVWYRAPFTELPLTWVSPGVGTVSILSANVATATGLHAEAHDLLPIGAAIRLTSGREIRRNFDESQGDTRRANEVPPGAQLGGPRHLMAIRKMRLGEEARRLGLKYPVRVH